MCKNIVLFVIAILMLIASGSYAQWVQLPSSPQLLIRDIVEINGILYLAHGSNGVYESAGSTLTWQLISNGLNTSQAKNVYQLLVKENVMYAATVDGIYKSTDAGGNWLKKSSGINIGPGALYEFTESIFEHNGELFTGAWSGIYRSTYGAENWLATNVSGFATGPGFFINHNGTLFAVRESINFPYGYKSTDGGTTWEDLTTISVPAITFLSEPGKLWAGTIHGVWLSTDNGTTWEHRSNGLSADPYNSSIVRVGGILITSVKFGGSGVYRSMDEGMNWEDIGDGLPFLSTIEKLIVYEDRIIAATSDGLWQRDTSEILTSLEEQNPLLVGFELCQNYPNPFNPETVIRYRLPSPTNVNLDIYNLLGGKIKTLVSQKQSTGLHQVRWNGRNDAGIPVANGVYVYQLKTNAGIQSKKLMLMR